MEQCVLDHVKVVALPPVVTIAQDVPALALQHAVIAAQKAVVLPAVKVVALGVLVVLDVLVHVVQLVLMTAMVTAEDHAAQDVQ